MPKWFWALLALLISSGIYFSIRYGLQPKPIPQLNPTVFENPEQIGIVTYHVLRASLRQERVLVLGSTPSIPGYETIWDGFIKAALADGIKIDNIFQRDQLNAPPTLKDQKIRIVKDMDIAKPSFLSEVEKGYQRGELELLHLLNLEATHLIPGTVTRRLQELPNLPVISISMLPMAVRQEDLEQLQPRCVDPRSDHDPEERLGCASSRISRKYIRKRLPHDKWVAAIERYGLKEYLLFISEPHPTPPEPTP
jgi:hypothetical protein